MAIVLLGILTPVVFIQIGVIYHLIETIHYKDDFIDSLAKQNDILYEENQNLIVVIDECDKKIKKLEKRK